MKKRFSAILTVAVALIMAIVMLGGCTFVSSAPKKYLTAGDSEIAAQSVKFNVDSEDERLKTDLVDAVAKVERTSVAVITESGAGSGVIVDMEFENEGSTAASWKSRSDVVYILTCHHMVAGTGAFEVYIPDETCSYTNDNYVFKGYIGSEKPSKYNAQGYAVTLVGGDFESDIALLKLDLNIAAKSGTKLSADKIVKAKLPSTVVGYTVRKGETVFSVGNPTGTLPGSVASGVVSWLERETAVDSVGNMTLMQIAVSTNPGNSGGGLYNLYGELVGITNAGNTNYTDINFAIPCYLTNGNGFVQIATQLGGTATENNYGYVSGRKVKFGFTVEEATYENATYVRVTGVTADGIAAKQGLKANDVIESVKITRTVDSNATTVVEKTITKVAEFSEIMQSLQAGDTVSLTVSRSVSLGFGRYREETKTINMMTLSFWFCNTGE